MDARAEAGRERTDRAIEHLRANHPDAELFVFSDEPNYTRHLMQSRGWAYTAVSSGSDLGDLYLMSLCRHFVISNSSYSWWGAWFGEHGQGARASVIIAPKEWVTIDATPSPCPARWVQLPDAVEPFAVERMERYGSGYPSRAAQAAATVGLAAVCVG